MNGPLNQTFENVWGEVEQRHGPTGREALRMVFMTGAATAIHELRMAFIANGSDGVTAAMHGLEAELERAFGQEVVQ
jgi:hypothetical protein